MARRRAAPKVRGGLKVQPAVDVSPGEMWEASGWILPEWDDRETSNHQDDANKPRRVRSVRLSCECQCQCGATRDSTQATCYMCANDIHHVCSSACAPWPSLPVGSVRKGANEQVKVGRYYIGSIPALPARAACSGGERAGVHKDANRHSQFRTPD